LAEPTVYIDREADRPLGPQKETQLELEVRSNEIGPWRERTGEVGFDILSRQGDIQGALLAV
jgi:hypothetical protein